MTRFALRGLRARPVRTALTALAILLGVAMISGALTLGDTMRAAADSLSTSAYRGTDAIVSQPTAFSGSGDQVTARPVPAAALARVRAVPGVGVAAADISDEARVIAADGKPAGSGPYFGVGLDARVPGVQRLTPFRLRAGTWATGPGQVVLDAGTAAKQHLHVGSPVQIATRGPAQRFRVVGVAAFGRVKSLGTASAAIFDLETARRMYRRPGYDSILVAAGPGTSRTALRAELHRALPGLQVSSAEAQDRFTLSGLKQFTSIIKWVLFGFGIVAVLVGACTIVNTLSITVAGRSREFALLRALGATRRQVLGSVLLEALLLGLMASAAGVVAGVGLAKGLNAVIGAAGIDLPQTGTVLAARTIVVGLAVGTLVTLVAGLLPARRATRVAPVSILREGAEQTRPGRVARLVRPVVGLLGRPSGRLGGSAGTLARANAMRNPGRTLATAIALTIGVALVTFVAIVGHGFRQTTTGAVQARIAADYVIVGQDGYSAVDPAALAAVGRAPGVRAVTGVHQDEVRTFGAKANVIGVDPATITSGLRFAFDRGSAADLAGLSGDGAIVRSDFATGHHLRVGSRFTVTTRSHGRVALTVRAIEHKERGTAVLSLGQITIAQQTFASVFDSPRELLSLVSVSGGASPAARRAITARLAAFPEAKLESAAAYAKDTTKWVDQLMAIFTVLLALAVLVSLFGMVNTLVLSTFERTRELGMLRAIGMTRRQVRRMVRHESIITSVLGATLGIAAGIGLALLVTTLLAAQGLAFALPGGPLVALVVTGVLVGVLAAVAPARRAARLDPLSALAYE